MQACICALYRKLKPGLENGQTNVAKVHVQAIYINIVWAVEQPCSVYVASFVRA